jgi:Ca-activated chloride channel homolog
MRRQLVCLFIVVVCAWLAAACGAVQPTSEGNNGREANLQATVDAAVAATGAAQPTSPPESTPEAEPTSEAEPTNEATTERTSVAEAALTPCPTPEEASEGSEGVVNDCEQAYQQLLAQYARDYDSCAPASVGAASCPRPEGLESDLKPNLNIQLVLDSSGSMAEAIGGRTKMEIAKDVMSRFVTTIPKEANVALRVYGHTGSNEEADRAVSCQGSELFYPFAPLNTTRFQEAIASFEPTGWTPIALALEQAAEDFANYNGETNSNIIYLVSDGIETCDGDPIAAARALHESDIQAVVNIVGFNVDAQAAQQLREAAAAGGGQYFEARNDRELQAIFEESINWREWQQYYNCVIKNQTIQWSGNTIEQTQAWSCVTSLATQEWSDITKAVVSDLPRYESCREYILEASDARRSSLINASNEQRQTVIDQARQQRDEAIQSAGDEVQQNTGTATP